MSKELPTDWFEATPLAYVQPIVADDFDAMMTGLLGEIEMLRRALGDGVVSGFLCAIDGTAVNVGAGVAYCNGYRYSGGLPVSFAGQEADTYTVLIDSTDDEEPYKAAVATGYEVGEGQMALCAVDWDGEALSNLVDLRTPWPNL